ncbi:hypothetical protein KOW79_009070 [Hemibagrus wyckioides]|uniref:Uncharacterized protein n=1 Tax=Hemibagrus wyckioides TaxID=337641 RepID=A0A9D3NSH8_9TELE|nr:hypothetical protein KOW79_009070 [Hemibagrus wyckioides]
MGLRIQRCPIPQRWAASRLKAHLYGNAARGRRGKGAELLSHPARAQLRGFHRKRRTWFHAQCSLFIMPFLDLRTPFPVFHAKDFYLT